MNLHSYGQHRWRQGRSAIRDKKLNHTHLSSESIAGKIYEGEISLESSTNNSVSIIL